MARWNKGKKEDAAIEKRAVTYYCIKGEYTFSIPEYEKDEFGEIVKNEQGKPKILYATDVDGNNRHPIHRHLKFERVPIKDSKSGKTNAMVFVGRFIVAPEYDRYDDVVTYLESARRNSLSGILTEDQYKKQHNPDAYEFEKKVLLYATENEELKAYNEKLRQRLIEAGVALDTEE